MTRSSPRYGIIMLLSGGLGLTPSTRGDRRQQQRYPMELDLEYRVLDGSGLVASGTGKTENISSGGILFHTPDGLPRGSTVELAIRWPDFSGKSPFRELFVFGRVVRSDSRGVAVRTNRFQFHKLGEPQASLAQLFSGVAIH